MNSKMYSAHQPSSSLTRPSHLLSNGDQYVRDGLYREQQAVPTNHHT